MGSTNTPRWCCFPPYRICPVHFWCHLFHVTPRYLEERFFFFGTVGAADDGGLAAAVVAAAVVAAAVVVVFVVVPVVTGCDTGAATVAVVATAPLDLPTTLAVATTLGLDVDEAAPVLSGGSMTPAAANSGWARGAVFSIPLVLEASVDEEVSALRLREVNRLDGAAAATAATAAALAVALAWCATEVGPR